VEDSSDDEDSNNEDDTDEFEVDQNDDDDDDDDDDNDNDNNFHSSDNGDISEIETENSGTVYYRRFGRHRKEFEDNDDSDSNSISHSATNCRQQEYNDDNELDIPELICRKDNDDSSEDDDNSVECSIYNYSSSNIKSESESPRVRLKNRYSRTKTSRTSVSDMTGMQINFKNRNGMTRKIANLTGQRRRGGAVDEDSRAGTTDGEGEEIYRKYSYIQEEEIIGNNNNKNICEKDNISDNFNDSEEEERVDEDEDDGDSIPGLQERYVEDSSDEEDNEEGDDVDDGHSFNNGMMILRLRGGADDAYSRDGTRNNVENEEADLYFHCSDDNRSTMEIIATTSEEHDDTNKEEAPSTSFEASHTGTVEHRQTSRSFVLDELDEDETLPIGGSMENDKIEGNIRISTWNPNGINSNQVQSILQQSLDLSINIQGYSEVNRNF
jgi:hypothetical protein